MKNTLTNQQISNYRRDGFIVIEDFFDHNELEDWRSKVEKAVELREEYEGINPGWHMNKKHWNTVTINNSDVSDDLVRELINHSYDQVIKSFPKKVQRELEDL